MKLNELINHLKTELGEDGPDENLELARQAAPEAPRCRRCGLRSGQLDEYVYCASDEGNGTTADEYVREHEGTYNPETGGFWCSYCYIEVGQPTGKAP